MADDKNFLEQMNAQADKKKNETESREIESFQKESFVKTKRQ